MCPAAAVCLRAYIGTYLSGEAGSGGRRAGRWASRHVHHPRSVAFASAFRMPAYLASQAPIGYLSCGKKQPVARAVDAACCPCRALGICDMYTAFAGVRLGGGGCVRPCRYVHVCPAAARVCVCGSSAHSDDHTHARAVQAVRAVRSTWGGGRVAKACALLPSCDAAAHGSGQGGMDMAGLGCRVGRLCG